MKSGLRGGKPRDMATFRKGGMKPKVSKEIEMPLPGGASMEMEMPMRKMAKGGMTSRGAGAAQRGYDYNIYKKGGKVKKYAEGGDTGFDPSKGVREYSFSDLFGRKKAPESKAAAMDDINTKAQREVDKAREKSDSSSGGVDPLQGVDTAPARASSAPRATPSAPSRPSAQERRRAMRVSPRAEPTARSEEISGRYSPMRGDQGGGMSEEDMAMLSRASSARMRNPRPVEPEVMRNLRRAIHGEERAREMEAGGYAKGGGVKMAGGGSCRGMGAATRGGKYSIK